MKIPTLSVVNRHGNINIILGLAFLLATIFEILTVDAFKNICAIISIGCFIIALASYFLKEEMDDERSEQNLSKAGHDAFKILLILLLGLSVLQSFAFIPNIIYTTRILLGIGYIAYGSMFLHYEKED